MRKATCRILREAKKGGPNRIRAYDHGMRAGTAAEWSLRSDMSAAIRAGQFSVFYQPAIHLGSGKAPTAWRRWSACATPKGAC